MAPVVDRLEKEYEGTVDILKMNVDAGGEAGSLASRYRVQYVPTFVFVNSDGTIADTIVGEAKESDLRDALDGLR